MNKNILVILLLIIVGLGLYFFLTRETTEKVPPEGDFTEIEGEIESGDLGEIEHASVVFAGTIPAASGPGIAMTLTLESTREMGGEFVLTEEYLGEEGDAFITNGSWEVRLDLLEDALVYELVSGEEGENVRYFELINPSTVRLLNEAGERIESELPYELVNVQAGN